jgi:ubiquinone/menaquinone biosynthesis C-methylase UbiE
MKHIVKILKRIFAYLGFEINRTNNLSLFLNPKYRTEISFWKTMLLNYEEWYDGELSVLYGERSPAEMTKLFSFNKQYSALLTWLEVHQKTKYLEDLVLDKSAFSGLRILDIGSGPLPSALAYLKCEIYCLDPLMPLYMDAGFPIHIYEQRVRFVFGFSENMPFEDDFFDAIISVNAIDHVDDFDLTAQEIKRVLKPGGKLRLHIEYHSKTVTEPLELNDSIVSEAFSWVKDFRKISESKQKRGSVISQDNGLYTLWSNF